MRMIGSFFFSSRRRHTRSKRDWSSDVCSSDLRSALVVALALLAAPLAGAEEVIDPAVRTDMLKRADGQLAHIETEYNDIFIKKHGPELVMSFQLKGYRSEERRVGKECRSTVSA